MSRGPSFLLLFIALSAAADEAPSTAPNAHPIFSETRRFVVTGLPGPSAMPIVRWAEDVAERLAKAVGKPPPFDAGEPLVIRVFPNDAPGGPAIDATQGYFNGRLEQRLVFLRPASMDQEDALEVLTALLLARYLIEDQPAAQRAGDLLLAPAWLSVGLAQNLFKESRARNLSIIADMQREETLPDAQKVLGWRTLPAGRWRDKYCAGAFVSWLLSLPDSGPKLGGLLRRIAVRSPTENYVLTAWAGLQDYPGMDRAWQQWIARPREFTAVVTDPLMRAASALESFMALETKSYALRGTNIPERVDLERLIEYRAEPWARSLSLAVVKRIDGALASLPPETAPALRALREYYAAVAAASKPPRFFGRAVAESDLRGLRERARAAVATFKTSLTERDRYLGAFDHLMTPNAGSSLVPPPSADPAVRDYLDRVEQSTPTP